MFDEFHILVKKALKQIHFVLGHDKSHDEILESLSMKDLCDLEIIFTEAPLGHCRVLIEKGHQGWVHVKEIQGERNRPKLIGFKDQKSLVSLLKKVFSILYTQTSSQWATCPLFDS